MASGAMISRPHIPVGEYLGSVYRPDVDYVDGVLEERNVGEIDHAVLQRVLLFALASFEETMNIFALQEVRVQTQPLRFRVPDVCLLLADKTSERIVTEAPLLCVEVLSPRDTVMRMQARCMDYLRMGVPEVWIFDPATEIAYVLREDGIVEVRNGSIALTGTGVHVNVEDVFRSARLRTKLRHL
jgi:Uma2 family endonuclease